jgi:acrylyl-CoA reductase (NADPH)
LGTGKQVDLNLDLSGVPEHFRALFVAEPDGSPARITTATTADLGEGDVIIEVAYSALNYKDGLALTSGAPVVRTFPMIGGIDLVGKVIATTSERVRVGDEVVVTGWGLGEDHPGGYAEYARVPAAWCEPIPSSISPKNAVALGTAGVTAMLCFMALERNRSTPHDLGELPLIVTGASGGVGSIAVLLGARLGYRVVASTGRLSETEFLRGLGADEVIDRTELSEVSTSALGKVRFGAGIDGVGGTTLVNLVRVTRANGTVCAYGLAGGAQLSLSVHPFILRGVMLAGINSVRPQANDRSVAWQRISELIHDDDLDAVISETTLDGVIACAPEILSGKVRGRIVVSIR